MNWFREILTKRWSQLNIVMDSLFVLYIGTILIVATLATQSIITWFFEYVMEQFRSVFKNSMVLHCNGIERRQNSGAVLFYFYKADIAIVHISVSFYTVDNCQRFDILDYYGLMLVPWYTRVRK